MRRERWFVASPVFRAPRVGPNGVLTRTDRGIIGPSGNDRSERVLTFANGP